MEQRFSGLLSFPLFVGVLVCNASQAFTSQSKPLRTSTLFKHFFFSVGGLFMLLCGATVGVCVHVCAYFVLTDVATC